MNTNSTASGKTSLLSTSFCASTSCKLSSVHSDPMVDGNCCSANWSIRAMASAELVPGAAAPLISAEG